MKQSSKFKKNDLKTVRIRPISLDYSNETGADRIRHRIFKEHRPC